MTWKLVENWPKQPTIHINQTGPMADWMETYFFLVFYRFLIGVLPVFSLHLLNASSIGRNEQPHLLWENWCTTWSFSTSFLNLDSEWKTCKKLIGNWKKTARLCACRKLKKTARQFSTETKLIMLLYFTYFTLLSLLKGLTLPTEG